jgi:hypothetical protein
VEGDVKLTKEERERRIFVALAPLIGLDVVPGSITQPDPPDIVCDVVGRGFLAVELVALDAPETRSRLDNMLTTDEAWNRALSTWPAEDQKHLRTETDEVFFSISFRNEAGLRDRTTALLAVQKFLLSHPAYSGVIPPNSVGQPRGLDSATIHRGHVTNGPKFSHFSAGRWSPPQVSTVEDKLRPGRYPSWDVPMELFAYAIHDEPDLAVGSLEQLQNVMVAGLPASAFTRVHVFDLGFLKHLWTYPA